MSIASEIERIQAAKETLKAKLNAKNDSSHQITNETLDEFGDFCDSIPTPTGTIAITENGTVDVTNYANAEVNVASSSGGNVIFPTKTSFSGANFLNTDVEWIENANTSNLTALNNMFSNCSNLISLNLKKWNTSNVTNMSYMFSNSSIQNIDISNLNIGKVTNLSYMFNNAFSLKKANLSNLSSNVVTAMTYMFTGCSNLTEVDFTGFSISGVTNLENLFYGCSKLENVKLGNITQGSELYLSNAFTSCSNIKTIDLSGLNASNVVFMYSCFTGCSNLTTINFGNNFKIGTIGNAKGLGNIFTNCSKLDNDTLNSILHILANVTSYPGTKTLKQVGLSSAQATVCQGLSNYQEFLDAGWTTGY